MSVFSVTFRFTSGDDFSAPVTEGEVKIIATDHASAREAFRATHSTPVGIYKIDSVRPSSL
jgi:hypothetical protein